MSFARSRNVSMDFRVVRTSPADAFASLLDTLRMQQLLVSDSSSCSEALVINCHMLLHAVPDETAGSVMSTLTAGLLPQQQQPVSLRTMLLKSLRSLDPALVVIAEEDADFTACDVVGRLRAAFNFLWIPYDAVDTFLPKQGSAQRRWYEAEVGWKVENVLAQEGVARVERQEGRARWGQRMRGAGFRAVGIGEEAAGEVRTMLNEHAAGWGMKREDDDLLLTWKGHNVVFASAWAPS